MGCSDAQKELEIISSAGFGGEHGDQFCACAHNENKRQYHEKYGITGLTGDDDIHCFVLEFFNSISTTMA
jgi:hypothetical protein